MARGWLAGPPRPPAGAGRGWPCTRCASAPALGMLTRRARAARARTRRSASSPAPEGRCRHLPARVDPAQPRGRARPPAARAAGSSGRVGRHRPPGRLESSAVHVRNRPPAVGRTLLAPPEITSAGRGPGPAPGARTSSNPAARHRATAAGPTGPAPAGPRPHRYVAVSLPAEGAGPPHRGGGPPLTLRDRRGALAGQSRQPPNHLFPAPGGDFCWATTVDHQVAAASSSRARLAGLPRARLRGRRGRSPVTTSSSAAGANRANTGLGRQSAGLAEEPAGPASVRRPSAAGGPGPSIPSWRRRSTRRCPGVRPGRGRADRRATSPLPGATGGRPIRHLRH